MSNYRRSAIRGLVFTCGEHPNFGFRVRTLSSGSNIRMFGLFLTGLMIMHTDASGVDVSLCLHLIQERMSHWCIKSWWIILSSSVADLKLMFQELINFSVYNWFRSWCHTVYIWFNFCIWSQCITLIQELASHWFIKSCCITMCVHLIQGPMPHWYIRSCCIKLSTSDSGADVTLIHQEMMHYLVLSTFDSGADVKLVH